MQKVNWLKNQTTVIKTFTNDDVKNMLKVYSNRDYLSVRNQTIMTTLFDTGLRCSELCDMSTKKRSVYKA